MNAVVPQEPYPNRDLVKEEELGGERSELAVDVEIGIDGFERTVLVEDYLGVLRVGGVEVAGDEDGFGTAEELEDRGLVDVTDVLGGLCYQVDDCALGVLGPSAFDVLHADVTPSRRGQHRILDDLLHLDRRVYRVLTLKPFDCQLLPKLLLGMGRQLLHLPLVLGPHHLPRSVQFEGLRDSLGELVRVVDVGLHLSVEVPFLFGFLLGLEGLRPHPFGVVAEGILVEHEGVLYVALFDVVEQLGHFVLLVGVLFLLVQLPVGMVPRPWLLHPQQTKQTR